MALAALEALKTGRTFIMIAHRLSTVQRCDRLYFLKDGRIEAAGTVEVARPCDEVLTLQVHSRKAVGEVV